MGVFNKVEVPDWKTQTVGEHTPELLENRQKLAALGLKDPWERNEAWRFNKKIWPTVRMNIVTLINPRALALGLGIALITSQYTFWKNRKVAEAHASLHH